MIDGVAHWRRRAMLRDRRFWFGLLGLFTVPNFSITGLLFHQIHLAELKDVSMESWTANYVLYAGFAILGTLLSGQLVDRFTARRVAAHTMLPTALACAALWFGNSSLGVPLFFALFGLASGMPFSALTAITAELYGTRFLGEIKSVFVSAACSAADQPVKLLHKMKCRDKHSAGCGRSRTQEIKEASHVPHIYHQSLRPTCHSHSVASLAIGIAGNGKMGGHLVHLRICKKHHAAA